MEETKTLREIGDELGITHQAVSEIIERALRKVRIELIKRNIEIKDLLND